MFNGSHGFLNREQLLSAIKRCCNKPIPVVEKNQNSGILKDVLSLLAIDELKDFSMFVGGKTFKGHRLFLSINSEVLLRMFVNNPDAREAELTGITADAMEVVLDYIYTIKIPTEYDEDVLVAADKLGIKKLKQYMEHKKNSATK